MSDIKKKMKTNTNKVALSASRSLLPLPSTWAKVNGSPTLTARPARGASDTFSLRN